MDRRTVMAAWTIFNDRDFVRQHHHQLDPEDVPRGALRWLVAEAKRLWTEEKSLLTPDVVLLRTSELDFQAWGTTAEEVQEVYADIVESRSWNDDDKEALRNIARKWIRGLHLSRGIEEAAEALESGDYEAAERTMTRTKHGAAGFSPGIGWGPKTILSQTRAIPTGITKVDGKWMGGIHLAQLGLLYAPSNTGKSMFLPHFAGQALKKWMNVLYYTTELTEADVWKRILSAITGQPINDVANDVPRAEEWALQVMGRQPQADGDKGWIETRYRDSGAMTAADIAGDIDALREQGVRIHMVAIDGDDLTLGAKQKKYEKTYEAYREVYSELSALAKNKEVAVWAAAQGTRKSFEKAYLSAVDIGDSIWKFRLSDLALAFNITYATKDKEGDPYMQLVVAKDRYYGSRDMGIKLRPMWGVPGAPGTVGFEEYQADAFAETDE